MPIRGNDMTDTRKAIAERLGAAIKNLLDHQWSHCRPAMFALQELTDAADAAREALAQPEPEPVAWTDARLRGIASDYFRDAKDWPAAILCLRHLLMEQGAAPPPPAPEQPVDDGSTEKTGTVPWPVVESYSGGADPVGIGGRVWLRMGDGPETVEYVPAQRPPTAAENAVLQDAAGGLREKPALSDERIQEIADDIMGCSAMRAYRLQFARAIERAMRGQP
jgi:hypothetical protein